MKKYLICAISALCLNAAAMSANAGSPVQMAPRDNVLAGCGYGTVETYYYYPSRCGGSYVRGDCYSTSSGSGHRHHRGCRHHHGHRHHMHHGHRHHHMRHHHGHRHHHMHHRSRTHSQR